MRFVDEVQIDVRGGDGGNGSVAFRREKHVPLGGPAGGDGGDGGSVVFRADDRGSTLMDFRYRRLLVAPSGEKGRGKDQYGRGGEDLDVRVPVGTQVFDSETGALVIDLAEKDQTFTVAKGGRGGRGNIHFTTPQDRAPRRFEPGTPGEMRKLRLELKLLADVGIVGFPNVGKSTLISAVSKARPKVADYPFTTLVPSLGVVSLGMDRNFVMADIPGLVEGAAEGAGLGHRFLKHVERCRVLLHVITLDPDPERAPLADFDVILGELERFDGELAKRPMMVAISKIDLPDVKKRISVINKGMKKRGHDVVHAFSAATGEGVQELLVAIEAFLIEHPARPAPRAVPLSRRGQRPISEAESSEAESDDEGEEGGDLAIEYVD
jgi:GTP-binding protein